VEPGGPTGSDSSESSRLDQIADSLAFFGVHWVPNINRPYCGVLAFSVVPETQFDNEIKAQKSGTMPYQLQVSR